MMSAKLTTLDFLKIKTFWNEDYDVNNQILLRELNSIAGAIMQPKFGNCSISMIQVIINSIL